MTATLYPTMPAAEYHADPAPAPSLSNSLTKILLSRSAKAAWLAHPRLNPHYVESTEDKFDLGTTAHAALLEGDLSSIAVVRADDWRKKEAKEARDAARAAGKIPLLERQYDDVCGMANAALDFIKTSEIAQYWEDAESEQTIVWQEGTTWLRCRTDKLSSDRKIVFDYKTTGCVAPAVFSRQMVSLDYHIQDAFYRRGVRALGGDDPKFVFLAQETEAPYECALFACDPMLQSIADSLVQKAIDTWTNCLATNEWPGYGGRVHWASAPAWLAASFDSQF